MRAMYGNLEAHKTCNQKINKFGVEEEYYVDEYVGVIHRAKSYHVWSFQQIGMLDPYPNEPMEIDFEIPKSFDDLVYMPDRYVEEHSPKVLYIPSKLMLFKLMRACIGITK